MQFVTVGDAENQADTNPGGFGAVSYEYEIGRYEVTNAEYTAFLNAVAKSDPYGLYMTNMGLDARGGISRDGTSGSHTYAVKANMANKPVNFVNWFDAARFANWMHNGQGTGDTETGAYTLNGATTGNAVARNAGARFSLPTENEWYKAAYYKGGSTDAGYWAFAMQSDRFYNDDDDPKAVTAGLTGDGSAGSTGNFANYNRTADWNGQDGNVTTVGTNGGPSFYGTFDQSGNVSEWIDLDGTKTYSTGLRGGGWDAFVFGIASSVGFAFNPESASASIGFRLVRLGCEMDPNFRAPR
jgi:sulfatase modifying factor 1